MSVIGTAPRLLEGGRVVEAGHLRDDLLAGAEAVVAVPLVGPDRVAGDVARHREEVQVRAAGRCRWSESATVKKSFGQGCRQTAGSSGSHPSSPGAACACDGSAQRCRDRQQRSEQAVRPCAAKLTLPRCVDRRAVLLPARRDVKPEVGGQGRADRLGFVHGGDALGQPARSCAGPRWSARSRAGTTPPSRPPPRCRSSHRAGAPSASARSTPRTSSTSRSRGRPCS